MALLNFAPEAWAFFLFIGAALAVYTGAIGSYSEHVPTWGLGQLLEWPIGNLVIPLFNSPFALLTPFVFIALLVVLIRFVDFVDPGMLGAVVFGSIVLALAA